MRQTKPSFSAGPSLPSANDVAIRDELGRLKQPRRRRLETAPM